VFRRLRVLNRTGFGQDLRPRFPLVLPPIPVELVIQMLPYTLSTLLYCFNDRAEVLLLERAQEPNLGLWSPPGGKLHTSTGESPYACACREAQEELGLDLTCSDLHLAGLISEEGYQAQGHWLMFLFEVKPTLSSLPPAHREGCFRFFAPEALAGLRLPRADRERIWPWFWKYRGGFFAARCRCGQGELDEWTLEEAGAKGDPPPCSLGASPSWIPGRANSVHTP
jgi:8-oxo-dGTP diphosphatase